MSDVASESSAWGVFCAISLQQPYPMHYPMLYIYSRYLKMMQITIVYDYVRFVGTGRPGCSGNFIVFSSMFGAVKIEKNMECRCSWNRQFLLIFIGLGMIYPIPSMYVIFTYIWLIYRGHVGRYTIHGFYGYDKVSCLNDFDYEID